MMRSRHPDGRTLPSVRLYLVLVLSVALASCATSSGGPSPSAGGLVVEGVPTPAPTSLPTLAVASPSPTPTPIFATEIAPPTAAAPAPGGVIWAGTITSDTSRQYVADGSPVNRCRTSWVIDLDFVVRPDGSVSGDGTATLTAPVECTPHPLGGNVEGADVAVEGMSDSSSFTLRLTSSNWQPPGTAELAGFTLTFSTAPCSPTPAPRSLVVPRTGDKAAQATINLSEVMTDCAGSSDDQLTDALGANLEARFACADVPADLGDAEITKLCR